MIKYTDDDGTFYFECKPSEYEKYIQNLDSKIDVLKCEQWLKKHGFTKNNDIWNYKSPISTDFTHTITLPKYFFKNGELVTKFGVIDTGLDLTNGSLKSTKNWPTIILPSKDKQKKVYFSRNIILSKYGAEPNHQLDPEIVKHYSTTSIKIPTFEMNEDKVLRWCNGEFDILAIRNFKLDFINWFIVKHPNFADKIFTLYEEKINQILANDDLSSLPKFKGPNGFFSWLYLKKGESFKNMHESILSISKFRL